MHERASAAPANLSQRRRRNGTHGPATGRSGVGPRGRGLCISFPFCNQLQAVAILSGPARTRDCVTNCKRLRLQAGFPVVLPRHLPALERHENISPTVGIVPAVDVVPFHDGLGARGEVHDSLRPAPARLARSSEALASSGFTAQRYVGTADGSTSVAGPSNFSTCTGSYPAGFGRSQMRNRSLTTSTTGLRRPTPAGPTLPRTPPRGPTAPAVA